MKRTHRAHQIQISLTVDKPRNVRLTKEFFNAAMHYRAATGKDLPGVTIKMIIWSVNGKPYPDEEGYQSDKDITDALNSMFKMGLKPTFREMGTG